MARFVWGDRSTAVWGDRATAAWGSCGKDPVIVEGYCELPYQMISESLVDYVDLVYGLAIEGRLDLLYGDAPQVAGRIDLPYGIAPVVEGRVELPYGETRRTWGYVELPYNDAVEGYCELPYPVAGWVVEGYVELPAPVYAVIAVEGYVELPWPVLAGGSVQAAPAFAAVNAAGVAIGVLSVTVRRSLDIYAIQIALELAGPDDFASCPYAEELTVTVGAATYSVFVEGRERQDAHGGGSWRLSCTSKSVRLDAPYAQPITDQWSAGILSSDLAQELAGTVTVSWQLTDWWIRPSGFVMADETPLAGLRRLAASVGGVLQERADGVLYCVPEYQTDPVDWAASAPDLTMTAADDIERLAERHEVRPGYNSFVVGDLAAGSDSLRLEPEGSDMGRRTVRGYRVPWLAGFGLESSGGDWVAIDSHGEESEERTEVVEFVGGVGRVSCPVVELGACSWLQVSLGAVTASEDGTLTAAISGQSLLSVTYTTRCKRWTVRDDRTEQVQVYSTDEEVA